MNKYKLTNNTKTIGTGIVLYQIQALKDFGDLHAGDLGGWIEKESNLSQDGDAWVYGNAKVCGYAQVCGNAQVYGYAQVCGNAQVCGYALVCDNAQVCDSARVFDNALVCDNALVYGSATVYGNAQVCDDALVSKSTVSIQPLSKEQRIIHKIKKLDDEWKQRQQQRKIT